MNSKKIRVIKTLSNQIYKPSSVVNSHLSWQRVTTTAQRHLPGTAEQALCPSTVLLQIGFTRLICLHITGELLPHLSILTVKYGGYFLLHYPWGRPRRPLAVIIALWSSDFPRIVAFASNRSYSI